MIGNNPPLVLLLVGNVGEKKWRAFQSESSFRGVEADAAIFLREPTSLERHSVKGCVSKSTIKNNVFSITDLLPLPAVIMKSCEADWPTFFPSASI